MFIDFPLQTVRGRLRFHVGRPIQGHLRGSFGTVDEATRAECFFIDMFLVYKSTVEGNPMHANVQKSLMKEMTPPDRE